MRKTTKKRIALSPHRAGNVTSAGLRSPPAAHKKAALKRRIQEILNGRSRFVIRKVPAARSGGGGAQSPSGGEGRVSSSAPSSREGEKKHRCCRLRHRLDLSARSASPCRLSVLW